MSRGWSCGDKRPGPGESRQVGESAVDGPGAVQLRARPTQSQLVFQPALGNIGMHTLARKRRPK